MRKRHCAFLRHIQVSATAVTLKSTYHVTPGTWAMIHVYCRLAARALRRCLKPHPGHGTTEVAYYGNGTGMQQC